MDGRAGPGGPRPSSAGAPQASILATLLRRVAWLHWAAHRLRSTLTVIGVALGVATVIGVTEINESVLSSFRHMVRAVTGASEIEVTSAAGRVDEALLDSVVVTRDGHAAAGEASAARRSRVMRKR